MRSVITIVAVLIAGLGALWAGTDGLRVLTAEGARRLAVTENPRPLPDVLLTDQRGEAFRFADFNGQPVLVEFIYTRCTTICYSLGETFAQIQDRVQGKKVHLISISFDPRDQTSDLNEFAERHGAVAPQWRVTKVDDPSQLQPLLDLFAVTVIGDGQGNYEHNAAVHLVDKQGRLVEIVDHQPVDASMEALWKRL